MKGWPGSVIYYYMIYPEGINGNIYIIYCPIYNFELNRITFDAIVTLIEGRHR